MNAASISRQLRSLGFRPVAAADRNRQGLRVTNSGQRVRVSADLDNPREALALANDARAALVEAGRPVIAAPGEPSFYVRQADDTGA